MSVFLCLSFDSLVWAEVFPGKVIGKISIEADDIFDTKKPTESGWLYKTANILHIQTNRNVIRRELIFKEGDPYNPDFIAETERNLRRFGFLRRARISTQEGEDGKVDVTVHTKDTWTLEPQFNFSRVGNKSKTKIGLVERNLFGTGKKVSSFYNRSSEGTFNTLTYRDQQFMGGKMELNTNYIDGEEYREYGGSLSKPFRSTKSKTSFDVSNFFTEEEIASFQNGEEVGRLEKESRETSLLVGKSFGSTSKKTRQGTLAFRQQNRTYSSISGDTSGTLKKPMELSLVEVGGDWQVIDFITEKHVEKFDRDEDFNLGTGAGFTFGVGQNWKDNNRFELLPKLRGQSGHSFSPGHFVLGSANYRSRIANDQTDDLLLRMELQYFNRLRPRNTLAGHLAYDHGYRLDPENQLLLGEETGLRGYSNKQFSGERRLLINLEDRLFFAEDVWHLMSFGGALFFDSGYAWGGSHNFSLSDMRSSVGVGFRLAMSRSSRNEPIRFDLAYALNDNHENSRLVFSIQSGLKFGGDEGNAAKR